MQPNTYRKLYLFFLNKKEAIKASRNVFNRFFGVVIGQLVIRRMTPITNNRLTNNQFRNLMRLIAY